jgi:hypothetical protein
MKLAQQVNFIMSDFIIKKLPYDLTSNAGLPSSTVNSGFRHFRTQPLYINLNPAVTLSSRADLLDTKSSLKNSLSDQGHVH